MTKKEIKELQKYESYPSVSILLPTYKTIPDKLQNPILVKDLIKEAKEKLLKNFESKDVQPLINSLEKLAEQIDYINIQDGLALFVNKDFSALYNLPFKVEKRVTIDKKFETRSLISALNKSISYWILSLSKTPTRLFRVINNHVIEMISPLELQKNMKGFPYQWNYEVTNSGKQLAVESGDLDSQYLTNQDISFIDKLDHILSGFLDDNLPLVILGTEKDRAGFVKNSKYKDLIVGQVEGAFSDQSKEEIEKAAKPEIEKYLKEESEKNLKLFHEAVGQLKHAFGLRETWYKANQGQIRVLLVEKNYKVPENDTIYQSLLVPALPEGDIINNIIDTVIEKDGKVVFVEPGSLEDYEHIAAVLRY